MKNIFLNVAASVLLSGVLIFSNQAFADLDIEVVDTNFNSSNKIVIDQEQIQKSHASTLPALLASQANISIASTSFQPNSIYLRGGDSSHILILIDGVPTYDASTVQRTVNLGNLNLRNIKKIEIIKGSQSVIYGGQALSGVIKIETFASDPKSESAVLAQGGHRLVDLSATASQVFSENKVVNTSVRFADMYNASPILHSKKTYPQQIGSLDSSILFKGQYDQIVRLNYSDDKNDVAGADPFTQRAIDTANFHANTKAYGLSYILRQKDFLSFSFSHQQTKRKFEQNSIDAGGTAVDQDYDGLLNIGRIDYNFYKSESISALIGASITDEKMKYYSFGGLTTDEQNRYEGLFLKTDFKLNPDFLFEVGGRTEISQGDTVDNSYQVGLSYQKVIKLEHSTGFKTPSLFQLYSTYGNPDLKPEKAKSTSLSFEGKLTEQIFSGITFFDTQFENLITRSGFPIQYNNVSAARAQGVELYSTLQLPDAGTTISLSAGYQEPKDVTNNVWLIRRPLRTASIKVSQKISDPLSASVEVNHTGSRRDSLGATVVTLNDYTVVNLVAEYRFSDRTSSFVRIENVEDKKYETNYSYFNGGVTAKAGVEMRF